MKKVSSHLVYLLILWFLPLAVYLKTLSPSILYVDAGTIVAAAYEPGIPNPPGFPFYIMIAHLFTKLPIGSVLFRVQLLSIISALGVLTLVYYLLQRFLSTNFDFNKRGMDDNKIIGNLVGRKISELSGRSIKVISLSASLILAFSYQFWSQTLNSESYIFTNFLLLLVLVLAVTFEAVKDKTARMLAGGVVLGLATGANPTIIQVVPSLILIGLLFWKEVGVKRLALGLLAAIFFTALVYSYLPIRALAHPFLNWGDPETPKLFLAHLHGEGLNIYDPTTNSINGFTGSPKIFAQSIGRYLYLFLLQFTPVLVPFILLGLYYLFCKNRYLFFVLTLIPFFNVIFGGLYLSGNQESWFIASYVIFAIFLGIGLSVVFKALMSLKVSKQESGLLPFGLSSQGRRLYSLFLILIPLVWWFPRLDRSSHVVAQEYADNLYRDLPAGSVLIGSGDFFNSLTHYEYSVNKRTDVFPVVANMWYILPWYRDTLRRYQPDLMPKELEGMIKMTRFEEYNEVMNWYIKYLVDHGHPVFVTPMVFRETVLAGTNAGKYMPDKMLLKAVPSGLTVRMVDKKDLLGYEEDRYNFKFKDPSFYNHPPFYLERNYQAAYNLLLREYGLAYAGLSEYFMNNGLTTPAGEGRQREIQIKKSQDYLDKAYEFAPFSAEIVNRMAIYAAYNKDNSKALEYFKKAVDLDPKSYDARLNYAKALIAAGSFEEAQKQLKMVVASEVEPEVKKDAENELARLGITQIAANIPPDWKTADNKGQGISFRYPNDWKLQDQGGMAILTSGDGSFSIKIYTGILRDSESKESWVLRTPVNFSGNKINGGLAQIPPFEATAGYWDEADGKKALEFVLSSGRRMFHIKVKPADSPQMKNLDMILSSIKF